MNLTDEVNRISFENITTASLDIVLRVREIRNEEAVRVNMYTDHVISLEEHEKWISRLKVSNSSIFYAVVKDDIVIGGVGVSGIDYVNRRADWAYYLSKDQQGRGTGSAVEFKFIDFLFQNLGIFKLNCEVIEWNAPTLKLHRRFGFLDEGVRRAHVWRNGTPHNAIILGLNVDEWKNSRKKLTERLFIGL
jgi:UDP-4-amino-4,6-dideoxy-N-acetyl-beta-L-altrosamine N-acetyltransferase